MSFLYWSIKTNRTIEDSERNYPNSNEAVTQYQFPKDPGTAK